MKSLFVLGALSALAACGVDGEPVQPTVGATIGVNSNGASAAVGGAIRKGPYSVGWGIGL
jgi:hypothetical protein